jgi:hypothetical protein
MHIFTFLISKLNKGKDVHNFKSGSKNNILNIILEKQKRKEIIRVNVAQIFLKFLKKIKFLKP